jgi:hypothetical protein
VANSWWGVSNSGVEEAAVWRREHLPCHLLLDQLAHALKRGMLQAQELAVQGLLLLRVFALDALKARSDRFGGGIHITGLSVGYSGDISSGTRWLTSRASMRRMEE